VSKTKELIVNDRKGGAEHAPVHIDVAVVERVESFKFLCVRASCNPGPLYQAVLEEGPKNA
jgi:hypothetical protein